MLIHRKPHDGQSFRQQFVAGQVVDGWKQESLGQVTRCTEDDHDAGISRPLSHLAVQATGCPNRCSRLAAHASRVAFSPDMR